ncbi:MAG: site-specific integrase, partial [Tissierellia bacterium]|nr:site-specific integrase [Tissierellia bacterium]
VRYRGGKRVTTELKGVQLKAYMYTLEAEELGKLEKKAGDPDKLREMTLKEFSEWFITQSNIAAKTQDWYQYYLGQRPQSFFKDKKIINISKNDMNQFFIMLENTISDATKKPLSKKTIKHYKTALHAMFQLALEKNIIETNPVSNICVQVPRRSIKDKYYTPEELKDCIDKLTKYANTKYLLIFSFIVTTGVRPGEMYGLKWKKIDFRKKEVLINRSLTKAKKGYVYKSTKEEDERTLILSDFILNLLKAHKEDEKIKMDRLKKSIENQFVFTNQEGRHLGSTAFSNFWVKFCSKYNIRHVSPYGLRHTTATVLAYNNVPMVSIAEQLGHASTTTTEIYVHAVEEMNQKMAKILEETLAPSLYMIK